jgi:hypothetical protein
MKSERKLIALIVLTAAAASGQSLNRAFYNSVTTGVSAPMLGGSVNQFHQLTVIASDITTNSCSGGWSGVIYLQASQDNVTWTQFGLSITAVADNAIQYTSTAGAFGYVRVNYVSGNTSACALTAWYSGTNTGYPSFNTPVPPATPPVQILGNGTLYSGQQAVTGTAAALATNSTKQACFKALVANAINIYLGPSGVTTSTGIELAPDEAVCLPVSNTNLVYVVASTTGASVSWIGTN